MTVPNLQDRDAVIDWCRAKYGYEISIVPQKVIGLNGSARFNHRAKKIEVTRNVHPATVLHEVGHGETCVLNYSPRRDYFDFMNANLAEGTAWQWALQMYAMLGGNLHDIYQHYASKFSTYYVTRQQCRQLFFDILRGVKACSKP